MDAFRDLLETLRKRCIFGLCGVSEDNRRTFSVVLTSKQEERREWLVEVLEIVGRRFPPWDGNADDVG